MIVALVTHDHQLADKAFLVAEDLPGYTLITTELTAATLRGVGCEELFDSELCVGEADYCGWYDRAFVHNLFAGDFGETVFGGFCDNGAREFLLESGQC